MKITEITVTDERGTEHVLRCAAGLKIIHEPDGSLFAATQASSRNISIMMAPGRWLCYRLTRED